MKSELEKLLKELSQQNWWARQKTIGKLMEFHEDEYSAFLEEAIRNHEDANLRNSAMEVYRSLGTRAFPSLFRLIRDPDPEARLFTVNILGDIAHKDGLPHLLPALNDTDENVRVATAEALGKVGDKQALDSLKKSLDDELWVALAALQSIGDIGGVEAQDILYECLGKEELQGFAITALGKAGDKLSIKYLSPLLENTDNLFIRDSALEAIIKIAERERTKPGSEDFRNLVPSLIDIVNTPDHEMKRPAFIALCWSEDMRGLPFFLEAVNDEDLQEYAIDGLLNLGKRASHEIIKALKESTGNQRIILAKVLSMLGENEALIQFKKDEDHGVRTEVAIALGSVNTAASARALLKMLSDPYEEVRLAARRSLDSLKVKKTTYDRAS